MSLKNIKKVCFKLRLPVSVSLSWSISGKDELEWDTTGSCEFLKFETHLKIEVDTGTGYFHGILKCTQKDHRADVINSTLKYIRTQ